MPSTCGLVAMTSPSHGEGRQLDPGQVYKHTHASGCGRLGKWKVWGGLRQHMWQPCATSYMALRSTAMA